MYKLFLGEQEMEVAKQPSPQEGSLVASVILQKLFPGIQWWTYKLFPGEQEM